MADKLQGPVFKVIKIPKGPKIKLDDSDCCGDVEAMYNYLQALYEWNYVMWDKRYGNGGGGTPPPPPAWPP